MSIMSGFAGGGCTRISAATITNIVVTDSSFNTTGATAVNTTTGYIKIIGEGFVGDPAVTINGVLTATTFVSSGELRVTTPSLSTGSYVVAVTNSGATSSVTSPSNLVVSKAPIWTTVTYSATTVFSSIQLLATSDSAITYSLYSGSLPSRINLSSAGTLTNLGGVSTGTSTFVIQASDAELQTTTATVSLSIILPPPTTIQYILVAGGGSGGGTFGGGGAGGIVSGTSVLAFSTPYAITIGGGGAGNTGFTPGNNSTITGPGFATITAAGGGGGWQTGLPGGSGGGDQSPAFALATGTQSTLNSGVPGITAQYGNPGGYAGSSAVAHGGGGGGAGAPGNWTPSASPARTGQAAGPGGAGISSNITGTVVLLGGGGGGGVDTRGPFVQATGGPGGGGNGGTDGISPGFAGQAYTGGGGGAGGYNAAAAYTTIGGSGGSGVAIIKASSTATVSGSYISGPDGAGATWYKFTGPGTISYP